jgi:DedD protein
VPKPSVSEEELQLRKRARRRLVGAIVLVLLVIVVVPMFLDHTEHKQPVQDIDVRIPPIPGQQAPPTPATAPPAPQQQQPAAQPPSAPPAQVQPPSPPESEVVISPPIVPAPPKPVPAPAAKPAAQEGFVIQLGAYGKPATAKQLLQRLKAQKFPAYTEPVKTPQGTRTRVRAGPYPTMEAAEKARERMRSLKFMPVSDAKVVPMGE